MKKLLIVLLVLALLFAGCAKRGTVNQTVTGGQNQSVQAGGGTASGNQSAQDIGNLFHVDTDKPAEAGGYDVPAAGQNST